MQGSHLNVCRQRERNGYGSKVVRLYFAAQAQAHALMLSMTSKATCAGSSLHSHRHPGHAPVCEIQENASRTMAETTCTCAPAVCSSVACHPAAWHMKGCVLCLSWTHGCWTHATSEEACGNPHLKPSLFIVLAYVLNSIMPLRSRRFWSADLGCRLCRCPGCMSRTFPVPVSLKRPLKEEYVLFLPPVNLGFRCELDCRHRCVAKLLLASMLLAPQDAEIAMQALPAAVTMGRAAEFGAAVSGTLLHAARPALCHPCACICTDTV